MDDLSLEVEITFKMKNQFFRITAIIFLAALSMLPSSAAGSKTGNRQKPLHILTIGDSNGALPDGWVVQLKKLFPADSILNISISGNTIGFVNGKRSLNTLANIGTYMDKAWSRLGKIDAVIFMIGTNDCKAVYKDSLSLVPENMRKIISFVKESARIHKANTSICIVSPPPYGPDELIGAKYAGGLDRVTILNEMLLKVTEEENVYFIDTFHILLPVFNSLSKDGVHLSNDGQMMIARIISENLKYIVRQK
jgi:lysophospholipase L1-like esterase